MFEFHGWLSLRVDEQDDPDLAILEERLDRAERALLNEVEKVDDDFSVFELRRAGNALRYLSVHGLTNHRYSQVIDLFRWVAASLPESYGLLYVWDNEDDRENGSYSNAFRVWRVAQGALTEHADAFLSPRVPTIEKPLP